MKQYLIFGLLIAALASALVLAGFYKGQSTCQQAQSTQTIKVIKDEAQSFANRPRDRNDRISRLCQWASGVAKHEGTTKQQLPSFCGTGAK